jgi:hypothetical protein
MPAAAAAEMSPVAMTAPVFEERGLNRSLISLRLYDIDIRLGIIDIS